MYSVLQDTLIATYADLVRTFGEPDSEGDGYKTDVEWSITFPSGVIATIYNWKNYGVDPAPNEDYRWHIGGHTSDCAALVQDALGLLP